MAKVTLSTLLAAIENNEAKLLAVIENNETKLLAVIENNEAKLLAVIENNETKLLAVIEKNEAKNDDRFQLVKQEFQSIRSDMNERFDKQDRTLELIATQTASTIKTVSDHEHRIKKLENPTNN
jgi:hypothetical protein